MSRVIKFRAFIVFPISVKDCEFGGFILNDITKISFLETGEHVRVTSTKDGDFIIHNSRLMQFTGLTDCNGMEIYEGDVVRVVALMNDHHQRGATSVLVARIHMGNACLCFPETESGTPIYPLIVTHELKIIGNIYEHPHLLEAGS